MLIFKSLSKESINYASCSEQEKAYFEQIMKRFYEIKQNVRDNDKNGLISPKQMSVWLSYFIKFEDINTTLTLETSQILAPRHLLIIYELSIVDWLSLKLWHQNIHIQQRCLEN